MNLSERPEEMEVFVSDMCHGARCSSCRQRNIGNRWQVDGQDDPGHAPSARASSGVKVLLEMLTTICMCVCMYVEACKPDGLIDNLRNTLL